MFGLIENYVGFHGTSKQNAQNILSKKFEMNDAIWFGEGIYFFKDDFKMAEFWSVKRYKSNGCVIKTSIEVESRSVMDLRDPLNDHTKFYHTLRRDNIPKSIDIKGDKFRHDKLILEILKQMEFKVFLINTYTYQNYDDNKDWKKRTSSRVANSTEIIVVDNSVIKKKSRCK